MSKRWALAISAFGFMTVLAGCSSSGGEAATTATVTAQSMAFSPKEITVEKGQRVKIVLDNKDSQLHDFSIDKVPGNVTGGHAGAQHDMSNMGKMPDVHAAADAGKSAEITLTPTEAGTYTFYCAVAGHKESGMQGTLIVQ